MQHQIDSIQHLIDGYKTELVKCDNYIAQYRKGIESCRFQIQHCKDKSSCESYRREMARLQYEIQRQQESKKRIQGYIVSQKEQMARIKEQDRKEREKEKERARKDAEHAKEMARYTKSSSSASKPTKTVSTQRTSSNESSTGSSSSLTEMALAGVGMLLGAKSNHKRLMSDDEPAPIRTAPVPSTNSVSKSSDQWDSNDYIDTYKLAKEKLQEPYRKKMRGIPSPTEMLTAYATAAYYANTAEEPNGILLRLREKMIAQCPKLEGCNQLDGLLDLQSIGKYQVEFLKKYIIDHIEYWTNEELQEELPEICAQGAQKYKKQYIGQMIYIGVALIGIIWFIVRWTIITGFWRCFGLFILAILFIVVMGYIYLIYLDDIPWEPKKLLHPLWKKK